jgi:transcriptional regulator with XRE-family HTH domain
VLPCSLSSSSPCHFAAASPDLVLQKFVLIWTTKPSKAHPNVQRRRDVRSAVGESSNGGTEVSEQPETSGEEMHKTQADPDTAERFITEKRLGERIRRLRLKKSMGLVELGRHTGLSASFLSQLETGRVVPTLRNLARIAMVFSKDLSYFFESEPIAIFRVHRKKDRVRMPQTGVEPPTYTFESLGFMVPDRHMDPYFAEFIPLPPQVEPKAHQHAGFEFLYVLAGELAVRHSDQEATLGAGDAVYFDSGTPHSYRCTGPKPAEALIVTIHQSPSAQPQSARPPASAATRPVQGVPAPRPNLVESR